MYCHPCFDIPETSAWIWEKAGFNATTWRKVRRYAIPFEASVQWRKSGERIQTMAYHRPISWYVRAIRDAGMVLTGMDEPAGAESNREEDGRRGGGGAGDWFRTWRPSESVAR